ncbi:hypothetical protein DHD80_09390 [Gramella sp. AN32]|nr:hypothetical protein [Gramella sp. AN32]
MFIFVFLNVVKTVGKTCIFSALLMLPAIFFLQVEATQVLSSFKRKGTGFLTDFKISYFALAFEQKY